MRDDADRIRLVLEELDKLPLPPHLAEKPLDYFAQTPRRAAQEVLDELPEGEPPSPLLLSVLNAGFTTPAPERTSGGRIGKTPLASQSPSPKIV